MGALDHHRKPFTSSITKQLAQKQPNVFFEFSDEMKKRGRVGQ